MNLIVCVDDHLGMVFHHRRQSRDRVLCQHLLKLAENSRMLVSPSSALLFENQDVAIDPDFLQNARQDDWCFGEEPPFLPFEDRIQKLAVCRWNRVYPADQFLDLNLQNWVLLSREEFPGSSHDLITLEVYSK